MLKIKISANRSIRVYCSAALLFFCLFILFNACKKDDGYLIKGSLTGFKDGAVIYLYNIDTETTIDSCEIKSNTFELSGTFTQTPGLYALQTAINNRIIYINLFIGNENINVSGDIKDFPYKVKITGSKTQDDLTRLNDLTAGNEKQRDSLVNIFFKFAQEKKETEANAIMAGPVKSIDKLIQATNINFIKTNPRSIYSLVQLGYLKGQISYDSIKLLYSEINPEIKNNRYAKAIEDFLKTKTVDVGDNFSDISATNQKGEKISLSDIKNKYILLEFTGTYCAPCIMAIDELNIIEKKLSDSLVIVSYNTDKAKEVWQASIKRDQVNWPSLWDGTGLDGKTCLTYKIIGVPAFFLINPNGKIIHKIDGYGKGALEQDLKKFFPYKLLK
jgi:thiol-disulfide isomerase/thioredoxin